MTGIVFVFSENFFIYKTIPVKTAFSKLKTGIMSEEQFFDLLCNDFIPSVSFVSSFSIRAGLHKSHALRGSF